MAHKMFFVFWCQALFVALPLLSWAVTRGLGGEISLRKPLRWVASASSALGIVGFVGLVWVILAGNAVVAG